jgi:predicted RNA binding protein YcfA (HicA-like mRNA interferase family)
MVVKELRRLGYSYERNSKGSHEQWRLQGSASVTVPRNLNSRHTANVILKAAGSPKRF